MHEISNARNFKGRAGLEFRSIVGSAAAPPLMQTAPQDSYRLGAGITKSTTVRGLLKPSRLLSTAETTVGGLQSSPVDV